MSEIPHARLAVLAGPLAGLILAMLAGCATTGPIAVENQQPFDGLQHLLLHDVPPDGGLNIFFVHGMRADADAPQTAIRAQIAQRLNLTLLANDAPVALLGDKAPPVMLDGRPLWTDQQWNESRPYLDIARYAGPGGRRVNIYSLNYWPPLVFIKCTALVAADSHLTGPSDISNYCRDRERTVVADAPASNEPAWGNKMLKTQLMIWGFGDAAVVMSPFKRVIRAATREALAREMIDLVSHSGPRAQFSGAEISGEFNALANQRFALVTESLGGYVAFDALTSDASGDLGASDNPLIHELAPLSATVLCRSVQAHLLANQIDLLSISDISVADAAADNSLGTTGLAETCAKITARLARPNGGVGAARPVWTGLRIVAYHDPNDQLTFYNRHGPNFEVTNVVAPFANTWIPFLVVDPLGAHVGQETDKRILDMVAFGSDGVTVGKSEAR